MLLKPLWEEESAPQRLKRGERCKLQDGHDKDGLRPFVCSSFSNLSHAHDGPWQDYAAMFWNMWDRPFLPNLMNTVVFLVETAQNVAVTADAADQHVRTTKPKHVRDYMRRSC